jgi:hypothetical protein
MRRFLTLVLALGAVVSAQYNDYPTGEYEFCHNRFVVSPLKMVGGMDPAKRDEGPKVNLAWTPNIDMLEARYEYIVGVDGTLSFGPIGTWYPALDSVKATCWSAGVYGRYYLDLGKGGYIQFAAQWYDQTGSKVRDGRAPNPDTSISTLLPEHAVAVSGPQISPVLGYSALVGDHLVLEAQMGFTLGYYNVDVADGPVATRGRVMAFDNTGEPIFAEDKVYKTGSTIGGFYFAQIALGVAW